MPPPLTLPDTLRKLLPASLTTVSSQVELHKGDRLFLQRQRPKHMYFVVVGEIVLERTGEQGHALVLQRVRQGFLAEASLQPAKPRPKRLKVIKAKTGAERMKAATAKASGGGGQVITGVSPQEGAEAIFKLLLDEGVLRNGMDPISFLRYLKKLQNRDLALDHQRRAGWRHPAE